jgi:hypothetical protein
MGSAGEMIVRPEVFFSLERRFLSQWKTGARLRDEMGAARAGSVEKERRQDAGVTNQGAHVRPNERGALADSRGWHDGATATNTSYEGRVAS